MRAHQHAGFDQHDFLNHWMCCIQLCGIHVGHAGVCNGCGGTLTWSEQFRTLSHPVSVSKSVPLKALAWQYATFARLGKAQRDFSALMRCSGHVCGTRSFGEENEMRLSGYDMLCPKFWGNSEVTSMMVCRAKYPNKAGLIDHLPRSNEKLFFYYKQLPTSNWHDIPRIFDVGFCCCVWSFGSTNCPAKLKDAHQVQSSSYARFSQRSHAHRIKKGSLVYLPGMFSEKHTAASVVFWYLKVATDL